MLPLLAALFLGAPIACPPDVGQIKWSGLEHSFKAQGGRYVINATVWDRNRDGKPSHNDLLRVESATLNGDAIGVSDAWVTIRGGLAKQIGRRFKRSRGLTAACESRFQIQGVPKAASAKRLARLLRDNAGVRTESPAERAQSDMGTWAGEICQGKTHVPEEELARRLARRARHHHRKVSKARLKRIARTVAHEWARECAHLVVPNKLTFE